MDNNAGWRVTFFLIAVFTLGLGIYGWSDSILAAICLPICALAVFSWRNI